MIAHQNPLNDLISTSQIMVVRLNVGLHTIVRFQKYPFPNTQAEVNSIRQYNRYRNTCIA